MKLHKQKKSLKNYIYFFEQHIFIKKMLQQEARGTKYTKHH